MIASLVPPRLVPPHSRPALNVLGMAHVALLTGAETDDEYALFEVTIPPGDGPPPHVHSRESETFYVVSGELAVCDRGEWKLVPAGGAAHLPRGHLHTFANRSDEPTTFIVMARPAGIEQMFVELDALAAGGRPDPRDVVAVIRNHGIEVPGA